MTSPTKIITRVGAAALAATTLTACLPATGENGAQEAMPPGAKGECPAVKAPGDSAHRQLRAMWIATVGGADWPKPGDRGGKERQQASFRKLMDTAKAMNLNAVVVQIRPNSDAFYDSPYEPWSQWITGKAGKDPGYDVLEFMLAEAHKRNLEFHAWFNPYRISRQADLSKLPADSPARRHPEWVRKYGSGLWYDPGVPQVRELATNAVMDVVRKYDIDAVHFDDYFYPYPEGGRYPDQATYKAYGKGKSLAEWRRGNVDTLVRSLSQKIHQAKPWVRFGISPFGVWRNKTSDPAGSDTRALQSYDDQYADTRKWVKEGWVDYITPQLYWSMNDPRASYTTLVRWWSDQVKGTGVQLTIGQAAYRVGSDATWRDPAELSRHLAFNKRYPQVRGDVYFSASSLAANTRGFAQKLRDDHYQRPAIPPVAKGGRAPMPAGDVSATAEGGGKGVEVQWRPSRGSTAYAVYRVAGRKPACAPVDPGALIATVRGGGIIDPGARSGKTYTYYVTALDRTHRESAPARGATVTGG
ncbi:glycoside hydrolase family 10 protein [Actinomadura sp. SCN-SB]|uniref:glycoside hydrolase family 10 protein n=1 Tax=Actinomadura sp. SCN-SB TaxID=3373092 RepID=UPI003753851E